MMTDRIWQQLEVQSSIDVASVSASGNRMEEAEIVAAAAFMGTDILVHTEQEWVL